MSALPAPIQPPNSDGDPGAIQPLTTAEEAEVLSFLDLRGAGLALKAADFDQQELVENLITKIRTAKPMASLAASRLLLDYLKNLAALNGHISEGSATRTVTNGQESTHVSQVVRRVTPPVPLRPPEAPGIRAIKPRPFEGVEPPPLVELPPA